MGPRHSCLSMRLPTIAESRALSYGLLTAFLIGVHLLLKDFSWIGNQQLYTLLELSTTLLAFSIGSIALIRYYTKKDASILFLGVGFLGVAILEAYDTLITSSFYGAFLPSDVDTLLAWSWFSSRIFLGLLMAMSILSAKKRVEETYIYLSVGVLTLLVFLFFTFVELPPAYTATSWAGRPAEFIPGFLFLLAFIGTLEKGLWKRDPFEHLLGFFLVVGIFTQFFVAPFSQKIFDFTFHFSQILKLFSYLLVFVGFLSNMYFLFNEAEESRTKLAQQNRALTKAQASSLLSQKNLEKALLAAKENQKNLEKMNKMMVGREMKMIELKNQVQNLKKHAS